MTSKTVPKLSLIDRAGVLYFRVMVPKDLRPVLNKDKIVESTKTSDKRQAERIAAQRHVEILDEFEAARRRLSPQPVAEVTPELGKLLAKQARALLLHHDDLIRFKDPAKSGAAFGAHLRKLHGMEPARSSTATESDGALIGERLHPAHFAAVALHYLTTLDELRFAQASGDLRPALEPAKQAAESLGLVINWEDRAQAPQIREALGAVLAELVTTYRDLEARNIGEVVATPALQAAAPALKPKKLRDVFDKWKASKKRPEDSERACERALIMFETWAKNPAIDKITREMGVDFRAHLLEQDTTTKTARDRLNWLLTLLKFASQDLEWITRHPWQGLSIDSKTTNKRRPWTLDELQRFFSLPLFAAYELPSLAKAGKDAAYWVPLLGLFTGARIGELCQLQVEDIDTEAALLHIKEDAKGQRLKTENAARTIPVHPELVRLGFLEFVSERKSPGKLWSSLPLRAGKPSGYFSQWFNETRKAEPVSLGDLPDFHCFRHTVRSLMAEHGVSEPIQDRITGHSIKGSTGTKVYTHHSLDALRKAVQSIQYPGLSLPRVYKAPAK